MQHRLEKVVVIGSGNVAEALAQAITASDLQLQQIYARNAARGAEIAAKVGTQSTDDPSQLAPADLYLIAVSDRAVTDIAVALPIPGNAVVAHTAGSVPMEALAKYPRRGVFYPLQTFTKGRKIDFAEIPLFLEASSPEVYAQLEVFALRLSRTVFAADSERRAQLHLAGVFACNFANHMYVLGEQILHKADLPFDVLKPLIAETAAKAVSAANPATMQTGPAVRGDRTTQERHKALLADDLALENLYETITQSIWETSKKI